MERLRFLKDFGTPKDGSFSRGEMASFNASTAMELVKAGVAVLVDAKGAPRSDDDDEPPVEKFKKKKPKK